MAGKGKEHKGPGETPAARYGDELLSANWNPVIELLEWSCAKTLESARAQRKELSDEDADGFLGRVYNNPT
jgi:hypothetical protein